MNQRRAPWILALVAVAAAACLPVAARWLRGPPPSGCALDGAAIDPSYRAIIVDGRGEAHAFCCLRCAQLWLATQPPPRSIAVTDEVSGEEIDAAAAYYVRNLRVTTPAVGNRIHVFSSQADAERYAASQGGTLLAGTNRPFP
jgi:hypothetical protein